MITKILMHLFLFGFSLTAIASKTPPHIDLDATSREYENLLKRSVFKTVDAEDREIDQWLRIGQRNLQWITLINSQRPASQQLSLSSEATQPGNDVTRPRVYNFKIIKDSWGQLKNNMPLIISDVIFGTDPLNPTIPGDEKEFLNWLLKVDSHYQISARYKLRKPWKEIMSAHIASDVRGFLNVKADVKIDEKLRSWSSLNKVTREKLTQDLLNICWNSGAWMVECEDEFNLAIKKATLIGFKNKYLPFGQKNYDKFFIIPQFRKDVKWSAGQPHLMMLPFTDPNNEVIKSFLKTNIENEWKWKSWSLKLDFIKTSSVNTTQIRFVPGSTPNVNGLAGSVITMDKNSPLTEYDVQWTIRHEFGHVLGFPDCYLEFYDRKQEAFVSYQLDLKNLMCSRRGHLQEKHYNELKRVYFK